MSSLLPCFLAYPLTKGKDFSPQLLHGPNGTFSFRDNPKVVSSVGYIGEHLTFLTLILLVHKKDLNIKLEFHSHVTAKKKVKINKKNTRRIKFSSPTRKVIYEYTCTCSCWGMVQPGGWYSLIQAIWVRAAPKSIFFCAVSVWKMSIDQEP